MGKKTKYPSIPRGKMTPAERALAETAEILTGSRGDGRDRALTPRDLEEVGILSIKPAPGGGSKIESEVPPTDGGGGTTDNPDPAAQTPSKPTGFVATGLYENVLLQWDVPTYVGHSFTEIYRSATDDFGTAVRVQTSSNNVTSDTAPTAVTYYYWIRHVNTNNEKGPLNATAGTEASTAQDVEQLLIDITGQIS